MDVNTEQSVQILQYSVLLCGRSKPYCWL